MAVLVDIVNRCGCLVVAESDTDISGQAARFRRIVFRRIVLKGRLLLFDIIIFPLAFQITPWTYGIKVRQYWGSRNGQNKG